MKTKAILLAGLVTLLTGCTNSNDSYELEKEVSALKEKVSMLEKEKGTASKDTTTDKDTNNDTASATNINDKIATFTTESERIVKAMNDTVAVENRDENVKAYMNIKKEADALDLEIDTLDDRLEIQYEQNNLSFADYRTYEKQLDAISDKLDQAEDDLEVRLKLED